MPKTMTTIVLTIAVVAGPLTACGSNSTDGAPVPGFDNNGDVPASVATTGVTTSVEPSPDTTPLTPSTTTTTVGSTTTVAPPAPTTTPAPATQAEPEVEYLRQGDEGPRIATMQRELIALDLLPSGSDTGVFDSATNSALLSFQGQWGLIVDGVFGPETDRALTAAAQSVAPG